MTGVPTAAELAGWPVVVDVPRAGRCLGLGRDASYRAAREGQLPGALRVGRRLVVVTSQLRDALGVTEPGAAVHDLFERRFGPVDSASVSP